jgi:hypothetical protein
MPVQQPVDQRAVAGVGFQAKVADDERAAGRQQPAAILDKFVNS